MTHELTAYLEERRRKHDILLMTHIVLGYPSFEDSLRLIEVMAEAGVDLIEMQIPFSEPIADGPVILRANQAALDAGATVDRCLAVAAEAAQRVKVPLLFMTYFNVVFRRGVDAFLGDMKRVGVQGAIIPDLPPEEGEDLFEKMDGAGLAPIFIYSPNTTEARLASLSKYARGFVYCVARKGVTGSATAFSDDLASYLGRCRAATDLPLAVGFGVKSAEDVAFLKGKADIAVVGSQTIRVIERDGVEAVGPFLASLRS